MPKSLLVYQHGEVETVSPVNPARPWQKLSLSGCALPPWREWLEPGELVKEKHARYPLDKRTPLVKGETNGTEMDATEVNQDQECEKDHTEVDTIRWG